MGILMNRLFQAALVLVLLAWPVSTRADEMPWVAVSKDKKGFALKPSDKRIVP